MAPGGNGANSGGNTRNGHEVTINVNLTNPNSLAGHNPAAALNTVFNAQSAAHSNALSSAAPSSQGAGALSQMLAQDLNGTLGLNIVQNASMVLRDGGAGTINLNLKPESLGTVKIKLDLTDNKVTGSITVQSEDALKAFLQQVHGLEQTFREQGFNDAQINVNIGGQSAGQGQGNSAGQDQGRYYPAQVLEEAAGHYEGGLTGTGFAGVSYGKRRVSLLA
jgi:flagellar hook-length control protein FliK